MKRILPLFLAATLALTCFAFVGCSNKDDNTIRLSEVTHSIFYAPLYVALNKGYFDEQGLTVELSNAGGSDKVMTALTSGSADIGLLGPEATVYVVAGGRQDYPVIFGQLTKRDGSFLVGKTDEPNFDWNNIRGKRVLAGRKGGMPAMALQYVVNRKGMTSPADTNLDMDVAFDMQAPVFESDDTVSYTTLFEPTASELVAAGKAYIVASIGKESGEVPYTGFSATRSYLDKHPDIAKKFLTAVMKGYRFMTQSSSTVVADALAASFSTTPKQSIVYAVESYIEIDAWSSTPVLSEDAFGRMQDIMQNAGQLPSRTDYSKIVDNTYANQVVAALA